MKTLNHLLLALLVIMAATSLAACRDKEKSDAEEQPHVIRSNDELRRSVSDTLDIVQQQKNVLTVLTGEVNDAMDEIARIEQIIDSADASQLSSNKRSKLRNDILLMKNNIQEKRKKLTEIESALGGGIDEQNESSIMQNISNLRQQLDLQKLMLNHISARLHATSKTSKAPSAIADSTHVAKQLTEAAQNVQQEDIKQKEQRDMLADELNECYYVIGTRDELKNHKIIDSEFIKKTKVMQSGNLLMSYFTKADKRTLNEISIPGNTVTLLTNHDPQSFVKEETDNMTVIKILDASLFWEYSNYLVVQIE